MSRNSVRLTLAAVVALACALPAAASAQAPPPPTSVKGHKVKTLAQGVPTPIAFAFAGKTVFVAAGGAEDGSAQGGVFRVSKGNAPRVPGTVEGPVYGIAWRGGALYVSSGSKPIRYRG